MDAGFALSGVPRRIRFLCIKKSKNQKMLRIEFWTSDFDVKKLSKRPRDPHNRIRLEKLCPKVVSDLQNAGRMPSKRRFRYFRPIRENQALNVNLKWASLESFWVSL